MIARPPTLPQEDQTSFSAFYGLAVSVLGCFGFAFLISSFVVFPVQERECKVQEYTVEPLIRDPPTSLKTKLFFNPMLIL